MTSSHRVSGPMPNPAGLALPFTERVTNECKVYLHRRFIKPTGWQLAFGRHVVSQEKRLQAIDQTIAMESSRPDESALHWGWDSLVFGRPTIPVIRIYPDSLNDTKVFGRAEVTRNDIRPQGIPSRYNFGTPVFASPQDIIIRRHIQSEQQWPNESYFFVGPKRIIQNGEPIGRKRDETAGHWEQGSYYPAFGIGHVEGGDKWVRYHLPADPDRHSEGGDLLYWNKKNFRGLEHKVALSLQYIGARGWNSLRTGLAATADTRTAGAARIQHRPDRACARRPRRGAPAETCRPLRSGDWYQQPRRPAGHPDYPRGGEREPHDLRNVGACAAGLGLPHELRIRLRIYVGCAVAGLAEVHQTE